MARFILRYSSEDAPEEHDAALASSPLVKVIDRSPKMMLVDASEDDAKQLADRLPGWTLQPEVEYKIPDARKRIAGEPS
jgi:hypothetical protein